MANKRGKAIDTTHLSVDQAEERGFFHRDYIAHCLRWTHVVKFLHLRQRYKHAYVWDVGCGKDLPLAKTFMTSRLAPKLYRGFDYRDVLMPDMYAKTKFKPLIVDKTDFAEIDKNDYEETPNVITCFEVLEHVEPKHVRRMLLKMKECVNKNGVLFISTPCYDPQVGPADNHVNEMKYEAFGSVLEELGFMIVNHYGTFASIKDYKKIIEEDEKLNEIFKKLRNYYDTNYLATIFAPMFPHLSRNCLWHLRIKEDGYVDTFPFLDEVEIPWTSSELWRELKDG